MEQGDTLTQMVMLGHQLLKGLPVTAQVIASKRYQRLMSYTGSTLAKPRLMIQRISNGYGGSDADPQKTYHTDTFHPTMKAWLFHREIAEKQRYISLYSGFARPDLAQFALGIQAESGCV